ncbi:MAG: DNA polymerase domain-containing protein [Candidatus Nitrosotenuis sp.]
MGNAIFVTFVNSAYGALLNLFFRFSDPRMGASVTATGRQITTHMMGVIGEIITGEFATLVKHTTGKKEEDEEDNDFSGFIEYENADSYMALPSSKDSNIILIQNTYNTLNKSIIYGDTDSAYFNTFADNKEDAIVIADSVAEEVNLSFPAFMEEAFFCKPDYVNYIKASREIVGKSGLFQAKKKYTIKIVDLEGNAVSKIKSMGSEIKKSDTPKVVQNFLKETVDLILEGHSYQELENFINSKRETMFRNIDPNESIKMGIAKAANKVEYFTQVYKAELNKTPIKNEKNRKITVPGHIRAAINYNLLAQEHEGVSAVQIKSGDKVLVFYLKGNHHEWNSIAIPSDFDKFPKWLLEEVSIDLKTTETKMIDAKLVGVFAAWGYPVPTMQSAFLNAHVVW